MVATEYATCSSLNVWHFPPPLFSVLSFHSSFSLIPKKASTLDNELFVSTHWKADCAGSEPEPVKMVAQFWFPDPSMFPLHFVWGNRLHLHFSGPSVSCFLLHSWFHKSSLRKFWSQRLTDACGYVKDTTSLNASIRPLVCMVVCLPVTVYSVENMNGFFYVMDLYTC